LKVTLKGKSAFLFCSSAKAVHPPRPEGRVSPAPGGASLNAATVAKMCRNATL